MDSWIERLSGRLVENTSRRGLLGRTGRAAIAIGAAAAGVAKLSPAMAACSTCGGGGCSGGGAVCGGTASGDCIGLVSGGFDCHQYNPPRVFGYWWYCCQGGTRWKCQDCCRWNGSQHVYEFTAKLAAGSC